VPRKKRVQLWRYSAGETGATVTVCERTAGGVLYAMVYDASLGYQVYVSLKHRNRDVAQQYARDEAEKLRQGRTAVRYGVTTLGHLLDQYLEHRTTEKPSKNSRSEDKRRAEMFKRVWGADTPARDITLADWKKISRQRLAGEIDSHGNPVRAKAQRELHAVTPGGLRPDATFIRAVFYWGLLWQVKGGGTLVTSNPFGAPAKGVRSLFVVPKNTAPARPIADDDRYDRLRAVARRVLMSARKEDPGAVRVETKPRKFGRYGNVSVGHRWRKPSYLYEMLTLAWETGRRRDAWRTLLASDLRWGDVADGARERRGIIGIHWKPTKHAEDSQVVPVSRELRAVLEAHVARHQCIGNVPLFPSPSKPMQAIDAAEIQRWFREAETLAELPHLKGGTWHPFRRAWATKRKHHADRDVMEGGGWKNEKVLKSIYQQTTNDDLIEMLEHPKRLRRTGGEGSP
jgi:hypothetical protein